MSLAQEEEEATTALHRHCVTISILTVIAITSSGSRPQTCHKHSTTSWNQSSHENGMLGRFRHTTQVTVPETERTAVRESRRSSRREKKPTLSRHFSWRSLETPPCTFSHTHTQPDQHLLLLLRALMSVCVCVCNVM